MSTRSHARRLSTAAALMAAAVTSTTGCGEEAKDSAVRDKATPRVESPAATPTATAVGPRRPPKRTRIAAAGEIEIEDGPFTDRIKASGLRLREGTRPRLSGRLLNLTDVSDVVLLELRADFYDRRGRYLGSGKRTFEEAEAFSDEQLRFQIDGGRQPRPATAAILTVPQLVNE